VKLGRDERGGYTPLTFECNYIEDIKPQYLENIMYCEYNALKAPYT